MENYYRDDIDAYTSSILEWFENNVDNVVIKSTYCLID